jgi:cell division septation protein DedD
MSLFWIGVGAVFGVGIGVVWSVPGIIRDWFTEPVETLILAPEDLPPEPAPLEQFRRLQEGSQKRPARRVEAQPPARAKSPPPAPSRPSAPPQKPAAGTAARVIAEIARESAAPPSPGTRVVQVASEPTRSRAEAVVARLTREGFEAYISDSRPSGATRYRVRVRPKSKQPPSALADELEDRGFSVWVTRE